MTNKGVDQKPSQTAMFAALRRTIGNKEFGNEKFGPDNLAEYFLPPHFRFFLKFEKIRENTKEKLDSFLPGLTEYMIARTAYFDKLFVEALMQKVPQIVLLGAGYDTRAYRFAEKNHGTKIFELDIAPTQERKRQILKKAHVDIPAEVRLAAIDFNQEELGVALKKAGFSEQEKTLFLWEGVSYYLDPKSVDVTLNFVSNLPHPENAIAFDYTLKLSDKNNKDYYGAKEFAATMKAEHASEALIFSIGVGELDVFLSQRGLKRIEDLGYQEIENAYLMDHNDNLIGKPTGHFCFAFASK